MRPRPAKPPYDSTPSRSDARAVFNTAQFSDGRAADLAQQAGGPIANPIEMGITKQHAVEQLEGIPGYVDAFRAAFPGEAAPVTYEQHR